MQIRLSDAQFEFVTAEDQFPAFVGGFGSGKTHAGISRALALKLRYPRQNVAYYLPTYDLVTMMAFPRFEEMLDGMKVRHKINKNEKVCDLGPYGQIICRTMDAPERIIAYEVADSIADELDTLQTEKARDVWNRIISRNRQKKPDGSLNTVGVVTTPEGFRFVYDRWKRNPAKGYRLIKAPTQSNAKHLPAGYIESLQQTYTASLLAAYLDGEFVNLRSGTVYTGFDRQKNSTDETIRSDEREKEALHIGMDFNVGKMAAIVHVMRGGKPRAVLEYTDVLDTPAMIDLIKSRHDGHSILVYPDASGKSRKSNNASQSDLSLLRGAGFQVCANPANPAVKDRVLAMNKQFESREYLVNPDTCPVYVECLEQQAYDKSGEPDKSAGHDHPNDAGGYFIAYKFPIVRREAHTQQIEGFI
jgi:hypothetical protein